MRCIEHCYVLLCAGYRSISFQNAHSENLELATLLIHLEIRNARDEDEDLYSSIQELRQQLVRMNAEATEATNPTAVTEELAAAQTRLFDLTAERGAR